MGARWVIGKREFTGIFTEKTILIAVVIQIFVAGFSSFLVVGLASLVDPESLPAGGEASLGYVGPMQVVPYLEAENLIVTRYINETIAQDAFASGKLDAVLVVTNDPWGGSLPLRSEITLPEGNIRTTLTIVQIKSALESLERDLRFSRSDRLVNEPVYVEAPQSSSYAFVYGLLVPLLVLLPIVLSGALAADSITEEVQRGTLGILLTSPAPAHAIVDGKLFANVALAPLLSIAWLGLLAANGIVIPIMGVFAILLLATAAALLFGVLACAVAIFTKDRNRAHLVYALLIMVVLGMSVLLPTSPMNAIARFAAGSPAPEAWFAVVATTIVSVGLYLLLKLWLIARPIRVA